MKSTIFVLGSLNMDLVTMTPRHPELGETIIGQSFATYPGGKGANQAVAAARLGGFVKMAGCLGRDAYALELLNNLADNHVDITHICQLDSVTTGVATITVDEEGNNSIIVVPGANFRISSTEVSACEAEIAAAGIILLQLEVPVNIVEEVTCLAKKHHIQVILNPAPAQKLSADLLSNIDYLIPNESELQILTGMPTGTLEEIRDAARKMLLNGSSKIIVTRGSKGVFYIDKEQEIVLPAFSVKVVDTTAAGDAFIGGFASALADGKDIQAALTFGSAAGALATIKAGAQTSLPDLSQLDEFLIEHRR